MCCSKRLPNIQTQLSARGDFLSATFVLLKHFCVLAMKEIAYRRGKFGALVFVCQLAFIIIFGCLVDYGWDATPASIRPLHFGQSERATLRGANATTAIAGWGTYLLDKMPVAAVYAMFQDIHVMIFVGFGFLMTFLRKYGYGAVGFNFLIAAFVLQWGTIMRGLWRLQDNENRIRLDLISLVSADFTAATALITLGVVLGKLSHTQYVIVLMVEVVLITLNEWICYEIFAIKDVGGSITIHLFGSAFGLALARTIHRKEWSSSDFNQLKAGRQTNDLFSILGTLFLWMFWPSFNAATAVEDGRFRAIYNTYYSIAASCLGAFMVSSFLKHDKFSLEIIQNSTLAGGVVVGAICDMFLYPYGALICGFLIGIISGLGFCYLSPILDKKLGMHDTCGVNNLHFMPSFIGGLLSAILVSQATKEVYGSGFYTQFPAQVPLGGSAEYAALRAVYPDMKPGYGWSPNMQAAYQLAAVAVTLAIAVGGGVLTGAYNADVYLNFRETRDAGIVLLVTFSFRALELLSVACTGLIVRIPIWDTPTAYDVFADPPYWEMPEKVTVEEETVIRNRLDRIAKGLPLNDTSQHVHMTETNGKYMESKQISM